MSNNRPFIHKKIIFHTELLRPLNYWWKIVPYVHSKRLLIRPLEVIICKKNDLNQLNASKFSFKLSDSCFDF